MILYAFGKILGSLAGALTPFVLAVVVVLALRGPVAALEERGISRANAVVICYLAALFFFSVVGFFIVPPLVKEIIAFAEDFPKYYEDSYDLFLKVRSGYRQMDIPASVDDLIASVKDTVGSTALSLSKRFAQGALATGGRTVGFLGNLVLAFVLGFWLLKDLPTLRKELMLLAGPGRQEEALVVYTKVSQALGGYLRGQFLISAVTAVIVSVSLMLLGVRYALVLGLITGVLNIVPYVGPLIGAAIAAIVAVFVSPLHALGAVGCIIAAQWVTDLFVTPRVMSEQVDLHPVLVIFSLLVGGSLFGVTGMLLSIPVAAVIKGLFVYFFERATQSKLCTEEGALFREHPDVESVSDPADSAEPTPSEGNPSDANSEG